MNNFEALVSLNLIPQIGSLRLSQLLDYFKQPKEIFKAGPTDLAGLIGERLARNIIDFKPEDLENDLALAKKSGVEIITFWDKHYPEPLKTIPAFPIVLYCLGRLTQADNLAIGIVGARRASFYGLSSAEKFAAELSAQGLTIVSGLARGVDTYAHRGALKAKGRTIAVMGSGFSHLYPAENANLADSIAACGAVISEFPMAAKPLAQNFPRRNRLISGLSLGVLITEAARNSGALITADFALEQGREVFALPGRIDSAGSTGTNALLKQGAKLVTCCDDILEELNLAAPFSANPNLPPEENEIPGPAEESRLYRYISRQPVSVDELVAASSLSCQRVLSLVSKLQIRKLIKVLPGKQLMRN